MGWVLAGVLLGVALVVEVFVTVFFPQGRGGPFTRRQNHWIWRGFRATARRRDGSIRDTWLSLAGPVLVLATITCWVVWLVVAFALIYLPWIEEFLLTSGTRRPGWAEAVYFSGYTAATLGLGDLVPDHVALRLLTVLEAFGGFALLSASVTYFLAVYRELIRKHALATDLNSYFGGGVDAVLAFVEENGPDPVARWAESVSASLSQLLLAHYQYPVLHFFRSSDASRRLPEQLEHLMVLRRRVREDAQGPIGGLARHPGYCSLQRTVGQYVSDLTRLFVPGSGGAGGGPHDSVPEAHRRLREFTIP